MSRAAQLPFNKNTRESRLHYRDLPDSIDATLRPGMTFAATTGLGSSQREDTIDVASHSAQRDAATGLDYTSVKQFATLSRQALRALGFNEIRRQCRLKFPYYTRREINQLARELHERAWKSRDREAVARVMHG